MADRLRDRGELALLEDIRRLLPHAGRVRLGAGDDAAVLAPSRHPLLCTVDTQIENVHFRRDWLTARALGRRAFEVSASDIAAMGGRAVAVLVAIAAPPDHPVRALRALLAGVRDAAAAAGAHVAGGNLAAARPLSITVTVLGDAVAPPVRRDGARPGDRLFVTGDLGGAALGLSLLQGRRRTTGGGRAVMRWRRPRARLQVGEAIARARLAMAMIDVSDGLLIDLGRLCAASGVGAVVRAGTLPLSPPLRSLPITAAQRLALSGGEDYELLLAVAPRKRGALAAACARLGCLVTEIGEIVDGAGVRVVGAPIGARRAGHQHFASRSRPS